MPEKPNQKPSIWQILVSVLGALIGVQSSKVYARDIERGHPWWVYVGVGIGIILLLITGLIFLVKWIIAPA